VVTVLLTGCGGSARSTPRATSSTATAGTNVRLAARFTILPSGALSPSVVAVPARVPIELIVVSSDGRAHRAVLHIRGAKQLTVPPKVPAEQLVPALPTGSYPLSIDGRRRGELHVVAG
jgi:hypothetical protein